jgi:hypothetical protein
MFAMDKRCGRCGRLLPVDAFNRAGEGRQHWCRECFRDYFRARGARHIAQVVAAKRVRREKARAFVSGYLATHPCADCGAVDPDVLEFDHVQSKQADISRLVADAMPTRRIAAEIARCEVVCANCHRRRTAIRGDWARLVEDHERVQALRPVRRRNVRWLHAILRASACVDCGERDPVVLEFDHRGHKRDAVTRLAYSDYSLEVLAREAAACEIRCVNCHRRRHRQEKRVPPARLELASLDLKGRCSTD